MNTLVHLCRHGQVDNPGHVLYGRQPGWHLSALGREMADRLAAHFADVPVTALRCSPLERARETMAPIAALHPELTVALDDDLLEAENQFEGSVVGLNRATLLDPRTYWRLRNPFGPSWGERYPVLAARMNRAIATAAAAAGEGGQAVVVSHQLPIWTARLRAQGRRYLHDPRRRECALASVTTFEVADGWIRFVGYAEPAADLLSDSSPVSGTTFRAGA